MRRRSSQLVAGILVMTLLGAAPVAAAGPAGAAPPIRLASAVLRDPNGAGVGWALLTRGPRGVRIAVVTFGLSSGLHGLHIHAVGRCVGPDFLSAGSHFNPLSATHGSHAGDLPNLPVGPGGIGHLVTTSGRFTLEPGPVSIFDGDGAALVVHANPDDYVTNPTGNSGARIACGPITPLGAGGTAVP